MKKPTKLDPNAPFCLWPTTRTDLVYILNSWKSESTPDFTPDDPRLTDALCTRLAEAIGKRLKNHDHVSEIVGDTVSRVLVNEGLDYNQEDA